MSRTWKAIIIAVVVLVVLSYFALIIWLIAAPRGGGSFEEEADEIALIRIEGLISSIDISGGLLSGQTTGAEEVINQIREADADPAVAAIMLRIDSPGGTGSAAEEIYRELRRTQKPTVASIGDIGASAAYWIASATDEIVASPVSDVGSIGVIIEIPNYEGLFEKLGVSYEVITQGKFKDLGSPARKITPEERSILKEQAKVMYDLFISDVAKGRSLSQSKVRGFANGLGFPGMQAKKMGLVDQLGNYQDAVDLAAKLGKIKGEPVVTEVGQPSVFDLFEQFFAVKGPKLIDLLVPDQSRLLLQR